MNGRHTVGGAEPPSVGLQGLIDLFNTVEKSEAQKLCREIVVTSGDVYTFVFAGFTKRLGAYECRIHNIDHIPDGLRLTTKDHATIAANRTGQAPRFAINKLASKLKAVFAERRNFKAHLFSLSDQSRWHLIYFDQRDQAATSNHWKVGGPHIHYVRETHTNRSMDDVWNAVCETPPKPPSGEHIRCVDSY